MALLLLKRVSFHLLPVFILLIGLPAILSGQGTDASIKGRVKNIKKEPLAGGTVTIKNISTGFSSTTITSEDGRYSFLQLPLGVPYTITVAYLGYTTQVQSDIAVNQADQLSFDFFLTETAKELENIVITAGLVNSRIDRMGASTSISSRVIQQIPAQDRNFTNLAALAPTTNGISISGQRASSTNYVIDGVSARNNLTSGTVGGGPYSLSIEAIREFEVITNV